jgi:hypothetical protein
LIGRAPIELPPDFTNSEALKGQIRDIIDSLAQLTIFNHEAANDAISVVCFFINYVGYIFLVRRKGNETSS